jgi:hypothetical protein
VTALDRAVALAEVDDGAVRVREHLHLDVAGILEEALDVDGRVREVGLPLAPRRGKRPLGLLRAPHHLQALAPAARRRLDRQRPAVLVAERENLLHRVDRLGRPGDDGHAGLLHQPSRGDLRPHRLDGLGRRPDPDEPCLLDRPGEVGVLGQEPVAGMDRLGARAARRLQHALLVEVALRRRAWAEQVGLIRDRRVQRAAVGLRVDGDRADPELPERPEDADGDLAAIGDEDFLEERHDRPILAGPAPVIAVDGRSGPQPGRGRMLRR